MTDENVEPLSLDDLAAEGDLQDDMLGRLADLEAERDDYRDRFMRALADTENMRKRSDRDRREGENYGGSKLARDMLPVYDNMRRALLSVEE